MSHPLEGVIKMVEATVASAGAGATYVALRPDAGCLWEVIIAQGYQDDGAVAMSWSGTDPDTVRMPIATCTAGGAGSGYALYLGTMDDVATAGLKCPVPFIATRDRYYEFAFTASAGAKNAYIKAVVREFRGVAVEA